MQTDRMGGVGLVLISALVFSCAGLFVRSIDTDVWSIIFWRGVFAAVFTSVYICLRGTVRGELHAMGGAGVTAAVFGALGTMAFIPAFKLTTIANVSLIYAVSPFVAATIMWIWIREHPGKIVVGASVLALFGVFIIVIGSVGGLNLKGDVLALLMTLMMSAYLCIYRRYPDTPAAGPAVLMSLLLLPVAGFFGEPLAISMNDLFLVACFGGVFSLASVTLAEGSRRLPAAQTALLSALETPLAPIWALLILSEVPSMAALTGGAIIMLSVVGSLSLQSVEPRRLVSGPVTRSARSCS